MVSRRKNPRRYVLLLALVPFFALSLETAAAIEAKEGTAGESELPPDRRTAEELYNATSVDARIFALAITDPEVRKEIERVFKRKLSDEQLQAMAVRQKAEADYWS